MAGHPVTPMLISTSNWVAHGKKAISEYQRLVKRQGFGNANDDDDNNNNNNSVHSAPETVDAVKSSSDENTVLLGHTSRVSFKLKYLEFKKLADGGFGSVYAGFRRSDKLPVAIKHVPNSAVRWQKVTLNGRKCKIPREVLIMHKAAGGPESVGKYAAVSILDWYDLNQEVLLVMERPARSVDLLQFMNDHGPVPENQAKIIMRQLVKAAIDMQAKGIFHRDIKSENILIEEGSKGLPVRLIDFGCSCIGEKNTFYREFSGTSAYTPPEFQFNGRLMAEPTTVWQLATLLFEMLDGFRLFCTREYLRNEIGISPMWSNYCQDFLTWCLALEPEDRASLEDMLQHPWLNKPVERPVPPPPTHDFNHIFIPLHRCEHRSVDCCLREDVTDALQSTAML